MTASHPLEIELKLALPLQQADAFLKRMARRRVTPLQQDLVTRYFDTPDFDLSAQGVALRVRRTLNGTRAGRRWLQTLKTEGVRQGGLSRRAEFEMPVARGALDWARFPAEALAYVPAAWREAVVPVFETRFQRTVWLLKRKGGTQIEVALDVGEVRAGERSQPLCEIELELKAGQPDALFALALEWAGTFDCLPLDISKAERGVRLATGTDAAPVKSVSLALGPGMTVEAGFFAICQACLAQFQTNLPGVLFPLIEPLATRLSPQAGKSLVIPNPLPQAGEGVNARPKPINDIEYVHQARVSIRRLRAAVRLFRRVCVLPEALLGGLHALMAALGPARDWDVLCTETLPAIAPCYPDQAEWMRGAEALEARRVRVRAATRDALAQAHPGAWLLAMQRWLQQHGWALDPAGNTVPEAQRFAQLSPLDKWAGRALERGHRPVVRGAREFAALQPLERHALRIAIKRQRYASEFFQGLFAGAAHGHKRRQIAYLAALRDAQDSLGRANDAHIAQGLLTAVDAETGPMREFALGWLAAQQAGVGNGESAGHLRAFLELKPYW
jgi:inorganic triphosphatase YgiF